MFLSFPMTSFVRAPMGTSHYCLYSVLRATFWRTSRQHGSRFPALGAWVDRDERHLGGGQAEALRECRLHILDGLLCLLWGGLLFDDARGALLHIGVIHVEGCKLPSSEEGDRQRA
eukprot:gnl/TRDRNA2_/TRDRNA2_182725_c0_seq1.p1 gnl/TRDRNA2_/TRDRNA2_182725_c0~~gnl/TRDRNA2_/TRDRNA2_182725_c0_seq1.p1  ORF type:complete len:116 (+),score=2.70 gnl/TRDRNA2_/TRDRNA2_182725_c0_seq1:113-460(+)